MIESIDLRFIRCYEHCHVALGPGINLFFGPNGVGKTTILEAAQVISTCASFKAGYLYEMIHSQYDAGKIKMTTNDECLALEVHRRSKKFFLDETKVSKQKDFLGRVPTVTLAPEHNAIIEGSKQGRQSFVDQVLLQQDPHYAEVLRKHAKVLAQKRALLKQDLAFQAYLDHAYIWHQQNKELTNILRDQRTLFLKQAAPIFTQTYQEVSQKNSQLHVTYQQCNDHAPLDEALLRQEYYAKRVLYGAQRDDVLIELEGRPTQKYASQGEKATILLGLKFAQWTIMQEKEKQPIFLLDDIGTTLDQERRQQLFTKLNRLSCQAIISTCDPYIQQEIASRYENTKSFTYDEREKKWM